MLHNTTPLPSQKRSVSSGVLERRGRFASGLEYLGLGLTYRKHIRNDAGLTGQCIKSTVKLAVISCKYILAGSLRVPEAKNTSCVPGLGLIVECAEWMASPGLMVRMAVAGEREDCGVSLPQPHHDHDRQQPHRTCKVKDGETNN